MMSQYEDWDACYDQGTEDFESLQREGERMRKQTIEIELPSHLIVKIERLAAKQGRTMDAVIDTGVSVYLQRFAEIVDAEESEEEDS